MKPATVAPSAAPPLVLVPSPKPEVWDCHYPDCGHVISARGELHTTAAIVDHLLWHAWTAKGDA